VRPLIDAVLIWKKLLVTVFPLLFLALAPPILGKDFWEEKSYKEWSERECRKMLQNSPWSTDETVQGIRIMSPDDRILADGGQPYLKYQLQLRSALPVRQAIIRMAQIAQKYDDLKPEQKQMFDQQAESFLAQDLSQWVIIYVTFDTNIPTLDLSLRQAWQIQTAEQLKNLVYLYSSKGDKVPIERFVPPQPGQRAFQFIFPRQYQGKEILGPEDKSLYLEFPNIGGAGSGSSGGPKEFRTDKMRFGGKVEY
jgi:hypothetical protein